MCSNQKPRPNKWKVPSEVAVLLDIPWSVLVRSRWGVLLFKLLNIAVLVHCNNPIFQDL